MISNLYDILMHFSVIQYYRVFLLTAPPISNSIYTVFNPRNTNFWGDFLYTVQCCLDSWSPLDWTKCNGGVTINIYICSSLFGREGKRLKNLCQFLNSKCSEVPLNLCTRVHHKNTFSKKQIVHTPTTPYRAYINHTQKLFFRGQVWKVLPVIKKSVFVMHPTMYYRAMLGTPMRFCRYWRGIIKLCCCPNSPLCSVH